MNHGIIMLEASSVRNIGRYDWSEYVSIAYYKNVIIYLVLKNNHKFLYASVNDFSYIYVTN